MKITKLPGPPLLSINGGGGTNHHGTLLGIEPITGIRNLISDFGNPRQGPRIVGPVAANWVPPKLLGNRTEAVLVAARFGGIGNAPSISLVHPQTGRRKTLSDFGDPTQGMQRNRPIATAIVPTSSEKQRGGALLALLSNDGNGPCHEIISVDPSGQRRHFRKLGDDILHGPWRPSAMTYLPASPDCADALIVGGNYLGGDEGAMLVRLDLEHDSTSFFSYFSDPGQGWTALPDAYDAPDILSLAVSPEPAIYALVEKKSEYDCYAAVVRIDPLDGRRQLVHDLHNEDHCSSPDEPNALAWLSDGRLAVSDNSGDGNEMIFVVDPGSGTRDILSELGEGGQGPCGPQPLVVIQQP